jgi:hypothetical protein
MRSPQNSVAPNASITFGQVFVLVHRSSRLAAGRPRAASVYLPHHSAGSLPAS